MRYNIVNVILMVYFYVLSIFLQFGNLGIATQG